MRCFIAINLPEDMKSKIFHASQNLEDKKLIKGRFVKKDDLHLTLKFLGFLPQEKIEEIKNNLKKIKFKNFECSVGDMGVFDEKHIKVVWIGLEADKLKELHTEVDKQTKDIRNDYKTFNSHITIARVDSVKEKDELLNEIKKINLKKIGFNVNSFYLMKSEFNTQGSKYKIIEKFELQK